MPQVCEPMNWMRALCIGYCTISSATSVRNIIAKHIGVLCHLNALKRILFVVCFAFPFFYQTHLKRLVQALWMKLCELTRQFEITPTKSATLPIVRTPTHSYNAVVLAKPNYWHNSKTFNHWVLVRSYLQLVKKEISFLSWFVAKRFRQLPGCGLRCWLRRADAIPRRLKLLSTTKWIF